PSGPVVDPSGPVVVEPSFPVIEPSPVPPPSLPPTVASVSVVPPSAPLMTSLPVPSDPPHATTTATNPPIPRLARSLLGISPPRGATGKKRKADQPHLDSEPRPSKSFTFPDNRSCGSVSPPPTPPA